VTIAPILLTLIVMGLTGGLHCAAMCSGLVVASERAMQPQVLLPARQLLRGALQIQLARVLAYTLLGAIAGGIGSGLWALQARPAQLGLYAAGNLVLAASGLWLLQAGLGLRLPVRLRLPGAAAWSQALRQTLTRRGMALLDRLLPLSSPARRVGAGLLWGLLPCGLVYSALSLALLTGSAASGAAAMAAFGIGTLPHMLLAGHLLRRLSQRATARFTRLAAAALMLGFSGWGFWRLLHAGTSLGVHGFCIL
jgi:sulfite exporter TauE/SafE